MSSPAPWAVLQGTSRGYRIAYERLSDTTFTLESDGSKLITIEPRYDLSRDSLCCPSRYRIGTLRWDGRHFRRSFYLEDAEQE